MRRAAVAGVVLALTAPSSATAARYAVGLEQGASPTAVAERVRQATGGVVSTLAPYALTLQARSTRGVAALRGVAYVERLGRARRLAFAATDPLVKRQWYLDEINAFDFWPQLPAVRAPVSVAVIDSGVDASHPELENRIEEARSFVDDFPRKDAQGHGTFVAGLIAAETNNAQGIAGIGFPVKLLVAKVVRADGSISPEAEAKAIRWAVERGAQVINLSLGGTRDPLQPARDTFSQLEASAVDDAVRSGVVVVAAVGNGDQAPSLPWSHANYPAALPHVIGVSALAVDGSVPMFSNRDALYNDLSAPGADIVSTLPRALTESRPLCVDQGYSPCGPREFRRGEGTSFAAPQVSAAAALMLSENPSLAPEQIALLLRRSAADVTLDTGCKQCGLGRDDHSGWGRVDVEAAVRETQTEPPRTDQFEPNDEAGHRAATLGGRKQVLRLQATLDYWDDQVDVYRVWLRRGQRLSASLNGLGEVAAHLRLWRPGTRALQRRFPGSGTRAVRRAVGSGFVKRLRPYRVRATGWYYLEARASTPGWGRYTLAIRRGR
jgi:subtilisin family serine protease